MTSAITNVFKNAFAPVTRSQEVATGFAIDALLESLISWGIRMLIGVKRPLWELVTEIALAGPLMSAGAFYQVKTEDKDGAKYLALFVRLQGNQFDFRGN